MEAEFAAKVKDPMWYTREILGVPYIPLAQQKIIKAVKEHDRVGVTAVHGIGKTFTLGSLVPWFLTAHPFSNVITTAPTNRQVNALLWNEIRQRVRNAKIPLGGELLDTPKWKLSEKWFAEGFSPQKGKSEAKVGESSNSSGQGYHAEDFLGIMDEATGIPKMLWEQFNSMATSANSKLVAIGNPTTKNCEFYEKTKSKLWHFVNLTCFDSPNVSVNGVHTKDDLKRLIDTLMGMSDDEMRYTITRYKVVHRSLTTLQWVITMAIDEWGFNSIPFKTRVLGEWPDIEVDVFFPEHVIEEACQRTEGPDQKVLCRYYGLDPARFGLDKSVLTIIENFTQSGRVEMAGKDTMEQANKLAHVIINAKRVPDEKVLIDSTGVGAGVTDRLREMQREGLIPKSVAIIEIHNGNDAADENDPQWKQDKDKERYGNLKAKVIDLLAGDLEDKLCLTTHDIYKRELPGIIYSYDSKGRKVVESKDAYKKRTGRPSPDNAESLAYANYGRHIQAKKQKPLPRATAL